MCLEKWVTPGCCAAAEERVAVCLAFWDTDFDEAPSWGLRLALAVRDYNFSRELPLFCPYCGKKLPEIEKDPAPVAPLCVITDGGYYCDTCEERLMNCQCYPPEFAWRVKPMVLVRSWC